MPLPIIQNKAKSDSELLASLNVKRAAIRDHVRLVAQHRLTGALIYGRPGIGKTWDIENTLEDTIPGNYTCPRGTVTSGGSLSYWKPMSAALSSWTTNPN